MSLANPFPALQVQLASQYYVSAGTSYSAQIYALVTLFALAMLIVVWSLGLRIRKGSFWLFRIMRAPASRWGYLTPHPLNLWLGFCVVFLALIQVYVEIARRYAIVGSDLTNAMAWRCVAWIPLCLGAWSMAWATALAPLMAREPNPKNWLDVANYPLLVNAYFIIPPLLFVASDIPLILIVNRQFNESFALFRELDAELGAASIAAAAGMIGKVDIAGMEAKGTVLRASFDRVVESWKRFWIIDSTFVALLFVTFFIGCFFQFKSLSRSMSVVRSKSGTHSRETDRLTWAYRSLVFTSSMMMLITGIFIVLNLLLATKTADIARGTQLGEDVSLIAMWDIATLGLLCHLVVWIRSFVPPTTPNASFAHALADPVSILPVDRKWERISSMGSEMPLEDWRK